MVQERDALSELQDHVVRKNQEEAAAKAISTARAKLVLGRTPSHAFFATLALKLKAVVDWNLPTAATNGKLLKYNPAFVAGLPADQVSGLVVHEVVHVALNHMARMHGWDLQDANIAADLVANPMTVDSGFTLPPGGLLPGKGKYKDVPAGKSLEETYRLVHKHKDKEPGDDDGGDKGGDEGWGPEKFGRIEEPGDGSESARREAEAEAKVNVAQAAEAAKQVASRQRGTLPGWIERLVADLLQPTVDWRAVLREFVTRHSRNDYSWSPPNKRYIHQGLYLPGLRSEELGCIAGFVDCSGSVDQDMLTLFASELQGILEAFDCELYIVYHDDQVMRTQTWRSSDGPLVLEAMGGGGTSHIPAFDHIEEHGLAPTCVVALTDLYSSFPDEQPPYPVLWAVPSGRCGNAPWGQVVEIEP